MGVSLKCACALQLLPWRHACLSSAHSQTTMRHCCLSIMWVDQGVVYLFDYPACFWNQGVRIIEVLLYCISLHVSYFLLTFISPHPGSHQGSSEYWCFWESQRENWKPESWELPPYWLAHSGCNQLRSCPSRSSHIQIEHFCWIT